MIPCPTFSRSLPGINLSCAPGRLTPREVALAKETAPPKYHRVVSIGDPYRAGRGVERARAARIKNARAGEAEKTQDTMGRVKVCLLGSRKDDWERMGI